MILRKNGVDMVPHMETADAAPEKRIQIPVEVTGAADPGIEIRISGVSAKDVDSISIYFREDSKNG